MFPVLNFPIGEHGASLHLFRSFGIKVLLCVFLDLYLRVLYLGNYKWYYILNFIFHVFIASAQKLDFCISYIVLILLKFFYYISNMIVFNYFGKKIPQLMLEPKRHTKLAKRNFQINLKIICSCSPHERFQQDSKL